MTYKSISPPPHDFRPMPQNPNFCACYGCFTEKDAHSLAKGRESASQEESCVVCRDTLAAIREIIFDVLDDGCPCASTKHPWELQEGLKNPEGEEITEETATEHRIRFVDEICRRLNETN